MIINIFNVATIQIKRIRKNKKDINKNLSWFRSDYKEFLRLSGTNSEFQIQDNYPILTERDEQCGAASGPYFFQDLFVAKQIYFRKPQRHVDVGSRIDGFVAHVATFREIEILDIRPFISPVKEIIYTQADLMSTDIKIENYCDSISCLHALEHFGLGRYGDKIDPQGHFKGYKNIAKILKKNGIFYFSVPIGVQRIEFNAHRIFGLRYLLNMINPDFMIESFSYIDDKGDFHENIELTEYLIETSCGCNKGSGVFVLQKK